MRRVWLSAFALGTAVSASFWGCGDEVEPPTGSTTTTTTSSGSSTTSSGSGGSMCAGPSDCPGMDTECRVRSCAEGACGFTDTPMGTPVAQQVSGDCKKVVCDGAGATTTQDDDQDVPDDGTACTTDACSGGQASHVNTMAGSTCSDNNGKVCDGNGKCVACTVDGDCASKHCVSNMCVAASCTDNVKNGNETDKDCGGGCPPCIPGKACMLGADCVTGVCTGNLCQTASCTDNVKNANETDKDCGGDTCGACDNGLKCLLNADCKSQVCAGAMLTCQAPSCTDGVKNQGEIDVDCAGPCAKKCGVGKACTANADCTGGACNMTSHTCDPTCTDGSKDGAETDVDCGGGACPKCALGKACMSGTDCASTLCINTLCAQVNGCDPVTAQDLTGMSAVSIAFGDALGLVYSPKCIKVSAGTKVTFNGTFAFHPLKAGVVENGMVIAAGAGTTPLPTTAGGLSTGTTATFTMSTAGAYGYYCVPHGTIGMNGTIFVQ